MKSTRTLVPGVRVGISVPDAQGLPSPVSSAVFVERGREVELNTATTRGRDFFLTSTGSRLTRSLELRGGRLLRHGALGGRPASGRVFSIAVGKDHVFGSCGARITLADLAGSLSRMRLVAGRDGASVVLGRQQAWAARMPASLAQVVQLPGPDRGFLLDVREAAPRPGTGRGPGLEVEGGRLSRSGPDERVPYVVLDAARIVAYALPLPGTPLDLVSDVMGRIRVEVL